MAANVSSQKTVNELEKAVVSAKKLVNEIKGLQEITKVVASDMKTAFAGIDKKTSKGIVEFNNALKETNKLSGDSEKRNQAKLIAEKKLLIAEKKLAAEKKKTIAITQKEAVAVQKVRVANAEANKEAKLTVQLNKSKAGSIENLKARLGLTTIAWNKLTESELDNTKRGKRLVASKKNLSETLLKLEKRTGTATRQTGFYDRASSKLTGTFTSLASAAGLTLGVMGAFRVLKGTITIFADFEKSMSNLQAVLNGTDEETKSLNESAKELGATTSFTATEVAGLQTEFAKLGFPVSDINEMTESTLNAAAAMGADLGEAAKLTGATLKSFGLASFEASRVNDVLSKATTTSALDFQKLSASMSTIAPVANAFGFSLEGTVSLLGNLSDAGFDASSAATATRKILLNLADSNGKLAKSLKEPVKDLPSLVKGLKQLKDEGVDLGEALELTDVKSVAAFSTFLEGTDSITKMNDALLEAGGTAQKMADTQLDNLSGSVTILGSAWEGFILSIEDGDGVMSSFIRGTVEGVTRLLNLLSGVEKSTKSIVDTNLELAKSTDKSIENNQRLIGTYEDLSGKVELTKEEKQRLDTVTNELISTFGDSIAIIDAETGSLSINIEMVKRKIITDQILQSEAAKKLLVEQRRLESQVQGVKNAETVLKSLAKVSEGSFTQTSQIASQLLEATKGGGVGFSIELERIRSELRLTDEEFNKSYGSMVNAAFTLANADINLPFAESEIARINAALDELGLNFDDLANTQIKSATATGKNKKEIDELTGAIELQRKVVSDLRKEKEEANEEDIADTTGRIELAEIELKRLEDLGKEAKKKDKKVTDNSAFDLAVFRKEQIIAIEEDAEKQKELQIELINFKRDKALESEELNANEIILIKEKANQDILDLDAEFQDKLTKQQEDADKKRLADRKELLEAGITVIDAILSKAREKQNRELDAELDALDSRIDSVRDAINNGNSEASQSLAQLEKEKILAEKKKEDLRKKEIRDQKIIAGLQLLSANSDNPNAVGKTLGDVSLLIAGLDSIQGFIDGTENVAASMSGHKIHNGEDGYIAKFDGREGILNPEQNARRGSLSNDDLVDLGAMHNAGTLTGGTTVLAQNNKELVKEVKEIVKAVREIPIQTYNYDDKAKYHKQVLASENKTEIIKLRVNNIYK
tara:strand:+ start:12668 stop:16162 length:3495 start_codon:yes stop_codon:yes gene_type:complete